MKIPVVKIWVLPKGTMPERQTDGSIGYDVRIRAVVSPFEIDPVYPQLRRTLFDFEKIPDDPSLASRIHLRPREDNKSTELVYRMEPEESVTVGIGFVTEMSFPLFYWVAPRSGLASKWGITVTNAPGTVDPDYRGEAGVVVSNRNKKHFDLRLGMRIAQIIFQWAVIPQFVSVGRPEELHITNRGAGGFGSTGLK